MAGNDDMRQFVVRGRGPRLFNLRVWGAGLGLLAVLVGWRDAGTTGALIGAGAAVAWQALLFRPRIVVTEEHVTVHFLWRSHRAERTTLESVDLATGNMLGSRTHELVLMLGGHALSFPWIAWQDSSRWWLERPIPTPRQARVLERLRSAIAAEHTGEHPGTRG